MKGCLHVVRNNKKVLTLPGHMVTIKTDGTIWSGENPLLGIDDPEEKKRVLTLVNAKKFKDIPEKYYTRMGDNPNGLWAGDDKEWENHPVKLAQDKAAAEKAAEQKKMVKIYLSSRGWGDYSACTWYGDITRPDAEILAECLKRLESEYDVDQPNQTDEEILAKIHATREKWSGKADREKAFAKAEAADIKMKIETGYCFYCESWCHGDCGHYTNDPRVKYERDLKEAAREADYGIDEG